MEIRTRSHVNEDRPIARAIGVRLRAERTRAGMTQATLAGSRYTKAYISSLEHGLVKPSMAAVHYLAGRLGIPVTRLLGEADASWTRLEVDIKLASGDWQGAYDAYQGLLEAAGPKSRPEILRGIAEAAGRLDRGEEGVRAGSEAAAAFDAAGRIADASWARYWAAYGLYQLDQGDEARRLLLQVQADIAAHQLADADLHVRVLIALAGVASRDDQPERALAFLEEARGLLEEFDDRRRATFLFALATSYRELGDLEGAVTTATQSLAHFRAAAATREVASIENELALVQLALHNVARARAHAAAARLAFENLGDTRWLAHITETEAQIELAAGDPERASERADAALALARQAGNRKAELSALLSRARAKRAIGDPGGAEASLEEAVALAQERGRRGQLQMALSALAEIVAERGDLRRAFELSQEALAAGRVRT